jgi:hypothetical protein
MNVDELAPVPPPVPPPEPEPALAHGGKESAPSMIRIRDADVRADPYPFYRRLREQSPVHWDPRRDEWVLTRYADVMAVLRNPVFSVAHVPQGPYLSRGARTVAGTMSRLLLFIDAPDHPRLRRLVAKAFSPRVVEQQRPAMTAQVDRLLDRLEQREEVDLIDEFAFPLPINMIAEVLGIPESDHHLVRTWSASFRYFVDDRALLRAVGADRIAAAVDEFAQYLTDLVEQRREEPRADLLSLLVAAEEEGDRLTLDELICNVVLLLAAGHGTTANLIGNGVLALMRDRTQWQDLCANPEITQSAVQELLRFDSPVQMTERAAAEDVEVGGRLIRAGEKVRPIMGAANRDPEVFTDPDRLDLRRTANHHLAFGHGVHTCLGLALARAEAEVVFARLAARFPNLELAPRDGLGWEDSVNFRGPAKLRVRWH